MGRKKVHVLNKIFSHPIGLRASQIDWLNKHPNVQVHKFFRVKLDEYIEMREELKVI